MSENTFNIDQFIQERHERDEQMVAEMSAKYGLDVRRFLSVSENWHHGLVWDTDKINAFLKPCPFCGGKAIISNYEYEDGMSYAIQCTGCKSVSGEYDERMEAIIKWNHRV